MQAIDNSRSVIIDTVETMTVNCPCLSEADKRRINRIVSRAVIRSEFEYIRAERHKSGK